MLRSKPGTFSEKPFESGIESLESRICLSGHGALTAAGFLQTSTTRGSKVTVTSTSNNSGSSGSTSSSSGSGTTTTGSGNGTNTGSGGGGITGGSNRVTAADRQFVQQQYESDQLEDTLFEIGAAASARADVRAFSQQAAVDHVNAERQDDLVATRIGMGSSLIAGITDASDLTLIRNVASHVNAADFDNVFLTTLAQLHANDAQQTQADASTLTNKQVRKLANAAVKLDNAHLVELNNLLAATPTTTTT